MREVFRGNESASWVLSFAERAVLHPWSITRARIRSRPKPALIAGGDATDPISLAWTDWYGWDLTATKIAELSNILLGVNGNKQKVWTPPIRQAPPDLMSMEQTTAVLMAMLIN